MADWKWRGDAPRQAQIEQFQIGGTILDTTTLTVTINRKPITIEPETAVAADWISAVVTALNLASNPFEFREILWSSSMTGGVFLLGTSRTAGVPFTIDDVEANGSVTVTPTSPQASRGPNHWDDPLNFEDLDTGDSGTPTDADVVHIQNGAIANSILYGIDQEAVTLASLYIHSFFSGHIGLPPVNANGYLEYRPRHLKIGADVIRIGEGHGPCSQRINLDTHTVATDLTVFNSNSSLDSMRGAINWKGVPYTGESYLRVHAGDVYVAPSEGETGVFHLEHRGGIIRLGRGVDLLSLDSTAGGGMLQALDAKLNGNPFNMR